MHRETTHLWEMRLSRHSAEWSHVSDMHRRWPQVAMQTSSHSQSLLQESTICRRHVGPRHWTRMKSRLLGLDACSRISLSHHSTKDYSSHSVTCTTDDCCHDSHFHEYSMMVHSVFTEVIHHAIQHRHMHDVYSDAEHSVQDLIQHQVAQVMLAWFTLKANSVFIKQQL